MGSARGPRAGLGGPPKPSSHTGRRISTRESLWDKVFGGPPKTARQRRVLPLRTARARRREDGIRQPCRLSFLVRSSRREEALTGCLIEVAWIMNGIIGCCRSNDVQFDSSLVLLTSDFRWSLLTSAATGIGGWKLRRATHVPIVSGNWHKTLPSGALTCFAGSANFCPSAP